MTSLDTQTVKVDVELSAEDRDLLQSAAAVKWPGIAMDDHAILLELAKMAGGCVLKKRKTEETSPTA
jgi:hypothetical protein